MAIRQREPIAVNKDVVVAWVTTIKDMTEHKEIAHEMEDILYEDVLRAIAHDICDDPIACARAALATKDLDFPRNCA